MHVVFDFHLLKEPLDNLAHLHPVDFGHVYVGEYESVHSMACLESVCHQLDGLLRREGEVALKMDRFLDHQLQ